MFEIELHSGVRKITSIFLFIGIWPQEIDSESLKKFKAYFLAALYTSFPIHFAVCAFFADDVTESVTSGLYALLESVASAKCFYLIFNREKILGFLNDPILSHQTESKEEYDNYSKKINRFVNFIRLYLSVMSVSLIANNIYNLTSDDDLLPLGLTFPRENHEIGYWVQYACITVSCAMCCISNFSNIIIWYVMLNYSIEYELLGSKFRKLGVKSEEDEKVFSQKKPTTITSSLGSTYLDDLLGLVKDHHHLTK